MLILLYMYASNIKYIVFSLQNFAVTLMTPYVYKPSQHVSGGNYTITNTQHISLHKSVNVFASGLQMWAIIQSLQISTLSAVERFHPVVGRKPATSTLFYTLQVGHTISFNYQIPWI